MKWEERRERERMWHFPSFLWRELMTATMPPLLLWWNICDFEDEEEEEPMFSMATPSLPDWMIRMCMWKLLLLSSFPCFYQGCSINEEWQKQQASHSLHCCTVDFWPTSASESAVKQPENCQTCSFFHSCESNIASEQRPLFGEREREKRVQCRWRAIRSFISRPLARRN